MAETTDMMPKFNWADSTGGWHGRCWLGEKRIERGKEKKLTYLMCDITQIQFHQYTV